MDIATDDTHRGLVFFIIYDLSGDIIDWGVYIIVRGKTLFKSNFETKPQRI